MFWSRSFRAFEKLHSSVSIISQLFKLWSSSFCSKSLKIYVDLKNAIKVAENVLGFWDNYVRTSSGKISLLRREYMWWLVNLSKDSLKISDLIKRDLSVLNLSDVNGKLASKSQRESFQQCFGPVNSFTSKRCSEGGAFWHSRNHILRCQQLQKYLSDEAHLFFQSVQKFM